MPETNSPYKALVALMGCALRGEKADTSRFEKLDPDMLFTLAERHGVSAMVGMALAAGGFPSAWDASAVCRWRDAASQSMRRNALMDAEREQIFRAFDEAGIWYMPLKGSLLASIYPKYGMREMSDNDVLFDEKRRADVRRIMEARGFAIRSEESRYHDAYHKPPVYAFEMHTRLIADIYDPEWIRYYRNVRDRLIPDGKGGQGLRFTDEDFYLFQTVHAFKHYDSVGTGLRILADSYAYCRRKGGALDWAYIRAEAERLNIAEFEEESRSLAQKLLGGENEELTPAEMKLYASLAGSATYGTAASRIEKDLEKLAPKGAGAAAKARYLLKRLVPDKKTLMTNVGFCAKHPRLIPLYLIYRAVRTVFCRFPWLIQQLKTVVRAGKRS